MEQFSAIQVVSLEKIRLKQGLYPDFKCEKTISTPDSHLNQ